MDDARESGWVLAEQRGDGRLIPLLVVDDATEAQELVRLLLRRDRGHHRGRDRNCSRIACACELRAAAAGDADRRRAGTAARLSRTATQVGRPDDQRADRGAGGVGRPTGSSHRSSGSSTILPTSNGAGSTGHCCAQTCRAVRKSSGSAPNAHCRRSSTRTRFGPARRPRRSAKRRDSKCPASIRACRESTCATCSSTSSRRPRITQVTRSRPERCSTAGVPTGDQRGLRRLNTRSRRPHHVTSPSSSARRSTTSSSGRARGR